MINLNLSRIMAPQSSARIFAAIFILTITSGKAISSPGECALDFLNIPVGAYGASLGQGGYAHIQGAQALFGNPAQIGENTSAFASYQDLLLDTRSQAVAANFSLGEKYSFGIGAHIFSPGDIDGYSSDNVSIGNIKAGDLLIRMGLARSGLYSYGLSVSYYNQRLDNVSGYGFGIGVGFSRNFWFGRLAISGDNIGPAFKIANASSPLPQRYSASAWIPLSTYYLDMVCDVSYKRDGGIGGSAGLQYSPVSGFFFRAGTNDEVPFSLGLGIRRSGIGFDYSYFPSGVFGDRHIFSFIYSK